MYIGWSTFPWKLSKRRYLGLFWMETKNMWEAPPLQINPHFVPYSPLTPTLPTQNTYTPSNNIWLETQHLHQNLADDPWDSPPYTPQSLLPQFHHQLHSHFLDYLFLPHPVEAIWWPLIDLSLQSSEARFIWYREDRYTKSKPQRISTKIILIFSWIL